MRKRLFTNSNYYLALVSLDDGEEFSFVPEARLPILPTFGDRRKRVEVSGVIAGQMSVLATDGITKLVYSAGDMDAQPFDRESYTITGEGNDVNVYMCALLLDEIGRAHV